LGQNFLATKLFFLYQWFINTTTTDIDMVLQVLLQFYKYHGFIAVSDVTMLFYPLLDD